MSSEDPRYVVKKGQKRVDILDTHTYEFAISYFGPYWSANLEEALIHAERTCVNLNRRESGA